MSYLKCYNHDEEVYRRDNLLWHIQGDVPVLCDDRLFLLNHWKADHPYTRDGVLRQLVLEDPIQEIARIKTKGAMK